MQMLDDDSEASREQKRAQALHRCQARRKNIHSEAVTRSVTRLDITHSVAWLEFHGTTVKNDSDDISLVT